MSKKVMLWSLFIILVLAILGHSSQIMMMREGQLEEITQIEEVEEEEVLPFPVLHIRSRLNPFIQERQFWHDGTLTLSGSNIEYGDFEDVLIQLRGRGNSTWWDGEDKRPLRLRFEEAQSLMGSEYEARDWILIADHFDRSLLRNYAALTFADSLGSMQFTPRPYHIQLYVNGEYMGVYLLTDERDVQPGRLEISWDPDPTRSGFMLELDARAPQSGAYDDTFVTVHGKHYDIRYPGRSSQRTPAHVAYVRRYLENVSQTIRSGNFGKTVVLIDLDTFVDFYLVQELFKNADVHSLSVFMHITGEGVYRRLYMGPVWDFDIAAGNKRDQPIMGSSPHYIFAAVVNYWYRYLMQMPEFREAVTERWNEIRDEQVVQMIADIRTRAERYHDEFARNFERHPVMGVRGFGSPPEILAILTFAGQAEHLAQWFEARVEWLDDYFNGRLPDHDPLWRLVEYYALERPRQVRIYDAYGYYRMAQVHPISLHDRTMISILEAAYLFDLSLHFDVMTRTYTLSKGDVVISYQRGTSFFTMEGEQLHFPAPGILEISDLVYIPLYRLVAFFGYEAAWAEGESTLVIRPAEIYEDYEI